MFTKPKSNLIITCIALIAVLLASACQAAAPTRTVSNEAMPAAGPGFAPQAAQDNARADEGGYATGAIGKAEAAQPERLVIRNANLSIVVADPAQTMDFISKMASDMGGFVVSQNLYKTSGSNEVEYPEATITVRVPAESLDNALGQIKAQVKDPVEDILSETVSGQDVTSEYTDLSSKLKNLQVSEEQLREILGSAKTTEEVLAVHQQLTYVREQIEVIQGQMKYYEESARLSAISVTIKAEASIQPLRVGGWQPVGVARDALQALIFTMQLLGSIAIWGLIYIVPTLLVIGLPIVLVVWLIRRGAKKRRASTPPSANPPAAS